MPVQDHTTKPRVTHITHQYHAAKIVTPDEFSANAVAQIAGHWRHDGFLCLILKKVITP
jgi:hypothetical protein